MSAISGFVSLIVNRPDVFFEIAFAVVSTASLITALTPTPRDDIFVGKLYKIVEALALNVGRAKDAPPNRAREPNA